MPKASRNQYQHPTPPRASVRAPECAFQNGLWAPVWAGDARAVDAAAIDAHATLLGPGPVAAGEKSRPDPRKGMECVSRTSTRGCMDVGRVSGPLHGEVRGFWVLTARFCGRRFRVGRRRALKMSTEWTGRRLMMSIAVGLDGSDICGRSFRSGFGYEGARFLLGRVRALASGTSGEIQSNVDRYGRAIARPTPDVPSSSMSERVAVHEAVRRRSTFLRCTLGLR
ncbi:hypothetical protein C2E23DRAFT_811994 [Lenzites betulinus]|nr:hypothetical protein C2E23DRAFT_811994 [Lenzites betulinus]